MIFNASKIPLNQNPGTLPDVRGALLDWFQQITFTNVLKKVDRFRVQETPVALNFQGVMQPLSAEALEQKSEGERSWQWMNLFAEPSLVLETDDVVTFLGTQYRVMKKNYWAQYGYVSYELVNDYTGVGP
jgi:hypothetical protein